MQKIILFLLSRCARLIVARHRPKIIGITGTVGKTTITSNIAALLSSHYGSDNVLSSQYHYNGEYGLPLTIIGAKTGGKNPFLWIWVFIVGLYRVVYFRPKYLVLEYGIDHPGEMDFMLDIAVPDIAIISRIAPNHLEQFGTFEAYFDEKMKIARDPKTKVIAHESHMGYLQERSLYFGAGENTHVRLIKTLQHIDGLNIEFEHRESVYDIFLPAFGSYQSENILPLALVSELLEIPLQVLSTVTPEIRPEAGRSRLLKGIGGTLIIDGSYNGGYESIREGLESLLPFADTYRIIIFLGDMRELGEFAGELHEKIGNLLAQKFISNSYDTSLYLVGPLMREYVYPLVFGKGAVEHSLSSRILGKKIRMEIINTVKPTIIYVKGSQNTLFLEEGIKEFLADPQEGKNLCRQTSDWLRRKEIFFRSVEKEGRI